MDRLFFKNGEPVALNPLQIAEGLSYGLKELTSEEVDAILNPAQEVHLPTTVSRAQGKASLIRAGLWEGVADYVDSISDPVEKAIAEVALNDTTHWERSSPFLNDAAASLGLSDEQLDQLFIDASKIHL